MRKEVPKHAGLGPRNGAMTTSGEEAALKISAAVKKVIGHNGCNCSHYDDDIKSRGDDAADVLPPGYSSTECRGYTAARDWNLRAPSSEARYESYGMARAEPHSAPDGMGGDSRLKPQANTDGCTDAVVVPGEGRAYRVPCQEFCASMLAKNGSNHVAVSPESGDRLFNEVLFDPPLSAESAASFAASAEDVAEAARLREQEAARKVKILPARKMNEIYSSVRNGSDGSDDDTATVLDELRHDMQQSSSRRDRFSVIQSESVARNALEKDQRNVFDESKIVGMEVVDGAIRGTVSARHVTETFSMFAVTFEPSAAVAAAAAAAPKVVNAVDLEPLLMHAGDVAMLRRTQAYVHTVNCVSHARALVEESVEYHLGGQHWVAGTVVAFDGKTQDAVQCDRCDRWHPLPADGSIKANDLESRHEDWFCEMDSWTNDDHMSRCVVFESTRRNNTLAKIARVTDRVATAAALLRLNKPHVPGLTTQTTRFNPGQRIALHADALSAVADLTVGVDEAAPWRTLSYSAQVARLKAGWRRAGKLKPRAVEQEPIAKRVEPQWKLQWELDVDESDESDQTLLLPDYAGPRQMEALLVNAEARDKLRSLEEYREWRTGRFVSVDG